MVNAINILKPSVCFEVQKVIAISASQGNCKSYQVQWAPSWISGVHLIGCEDLIEQFECELKERENGIKVEVGIHEQLEEEHVEETEEIVASDGQDGGVLLFNKNPRDEIMQDVNIPANSSEQQLGEDIDNDAHITAGINSNSYKDSTSCPSRYLGNIHHKSLDSIIQDISESRIEHFVARNTIHPDFQNTPDKDESVDCTMSLQSNKDAICGNSMVINSAGTTVIISDFTNHEHSAGYQLPKAVECYDEKEGNIKICEDIDCAPPKKKVKLKKNFTCDICTKTFSRLFNMKRHCKIHTVVKDIKEGSNGGKVDFHEATHNIKRETSTNLFPDEFCAGIKAEARTHAMKALRHKCDVCLKAFSSDIDLIKHSRTHTGEHPFECK